MVYTPVRTIASGSHLLPWETMHLTEISRHMDRFYSSTATNAEHTSVHRTLCRMVIALPIIVESRSRLFQFRYIWF